MAKMEAIGQLAAGVAHNLSSLLNVITGDASLLLEVEALPVPARESAHRIFAAGERAASLVGQLLIFSGRQPLRPQSLDLNECIAGLSPTWRRLGGEGIKQELRLAEALPRIMADSAMVSQLLMNLVTNACDAMPQGGTLLVATEARTITEAEVPRYPEGRAGSFVCLTIGDTGRGISPATWPHIFEPFFTTKEIGKGIGLGLATGFGIVQQHAGWLAVETAVGVGTRFQVFLPVAANGEVAAPAESKGPTGGETVLLVEDEPLLREITAFMLQKYGYRVLQAGSGTEALETWKWYAAKIDLLFTDMVMPEGLTGTELAAKLRGEKPSLKVVYSSAYSSEMMGQVFAPKEVVHFLQKPYRPEALASIIRRALDGAAPQ